MGAGRNLAPRHAKHAPVAAGQTHRATSPSLHERHDLAIDGAAQNHLDDLHDGVVGDTQAVDEARCDPEPLEGRADLGAATVHDDRAQADVFEQDDVDRERGAKLFVAHRVAAVFDHDSAIVEAPDVGKRFDQHLGLVDQLLHVNA
jgi:hypothetical protein